MIIFRLDVYGKGEGCLRCPQHPDLEGADVQSGVLETQKVTRISVSGGPASLFHAPAWQFWV